MIVDWNGKEVFEGATVVDDNRVEYTVISVDTVTLRLRDTISGKIKIVEDCHLRYVI